MDDPKKEYLGDGVYAIFDNFCIWLHTNNPDYPTDRVCLEPEVMERLKQFSDRCFGKINE